MYETTCVRTKLINLLQGYYLLLIDSVFVYTTLINEHQNRDSIFITLSIQLKNIISRWIIKGRYNTFLLNFLINAYVTNSSKRKKLYKYQGRL